MSYLEKSFGQIKKLHKTNSKLISYANVNFGNKVKIVYKKYTKLVTIVIYKFSVFKTNLSKKNLSVIES